MSKVYTVVKFVIGGIANFLRRVDWMVLLLIVSATAAIVWFGANAKDPTLLGEVLAFSITLFAVIRFPDVSKLKAFGVEVERAIKAAEQASATVEQLRTVASTSGRLVLDLAGLSGRVGARPLPERKRLREEVVASLKAVGCSEADIAAATRLLDQSIRFDLALRVINLAFIFTTDSNLFQERLRTLHGWTSRGSLHSATETFDAPAPTALRKLITDHQLDDARVLRRLDAYERYDMGGELPRLATTDDDEEMEAACREMVRAAMARQMAETE